MSLAIAILAQQNFGFKLYGAVMNGYSAQELAEMFQMPVHEIQERLDATMLLARQVELKLNRNSPAFKN
jgi:hypothetical protein